jgi:hypothetical protein
MIRSHQRIAGVILCFLPLIAFPSCTHKEPTERLGSKVEVWEMHITGETEATYRMQLRKARVEKDLYSIKGQFSGMADDHIGGRGRVECIFNGKIEGNHIKADFTGHGDMAISLSISGSFWGTLYESKGSGEWRVSHEEGQSIGHWTMRRVSPSQ